jgi:hypothetical protein
MATKKRKRRSREAIEDEKTFQLVLGLYMFGAALVYTSYHARASFILQGNTMGEWSCTVILGLIVIVTFAGTLKLVQAAKRGWREGSKLSRANVRRRKPPGAKPKQPALELYSPPGCEHGPITLHEDDPKEKKGPTFH